MLIPILLLLPLVESTSIRYQSPGCCGGNSFVTRAVAVLQNAPITGTITFTQSFVTGPVAVQGTISGLNPGQHGFHIHQLGNTTGGCTSMAGHFNPLLQNHGAPTDAARHAGDLGNINADQTGIANVQITDNRLSLNGPYSIVGRGLVVHSAVDDLGRGGNETSLTTGNAGGRLSCAVIAIAEEQIYYPGR